MSNVGNRYKVGVFVIVSLGVFIFSMVILGVLNYFKPKYVFMTVVENSVQGLEKGAKVKLKGVTIGKVDDIKISPNGKSILIFMEFNPSSVSTRFSKELAESSEREELFKTLLHERIKDGLRCQLRYGGITGNLYQEMSYFDPKKYPPKEYTLFPDHPPYMPSVPPVLLENILNKVQVALDKIAQINVDEIIQGVDQLIATGNKLLNNKDIKVIIDEIKTTTQNLQEITETVKTNLTEKNINQLSNKIDSIISNLNKTLTQVETLVNEVNGELKLAKIPATTESARKFMDETTVTARKIGDSVEKVTGSIDQAGGAVEKLSKLRGELESSLQNFNQTMNSAKTLLDYLEKNPSSIIHGKQGKPVIKP